MYAPHHHPDGNRISSLSLSSATTLTSSTVQGHGFEDLSSVSYPKRFEASSTTLVPISSHRHRRRPHVSSPTSKPGLGHGHGTGTGARKKKNFSAAVKDLNEIYGVAGWPTVSPIPEEAFFTKPRSSTTTNTTKTSKGSGLRSAPSSSSSSMCSSPPSESSPGVLLPLLSSLNLLRLGKRQRQRQRRSELPPSLPLIKPAIFGKASLSRRSTLEQTLKMDSCGDTSSK